MCVCMCVCAANIKTVYATAQQSGDQPGAILAAPGAI